MFFRKLFGKLRVEGERGIMTRKGQWGDNFQTLEVLLQHLRLCTFNHTSLSVRLAVRFTVKSDNVDQLVLRFRRAYFIMFEDADVDRDPTSGTDHVSVTLDQFLINYLGIPIRPEDVVTVLGEAVDQFVKHLAMLVSEENSRSSYYQRQYTALMAEARELMQAIVLASDLYHSADKT